LRVPLEGAKGGEAALGTLAPTNELAGAAFKSIPVTTRRLDDMILPTVGLIKIDVEGMRKRFFVARGELSSVIIHV
jgi:hypothetical protein